MIVILICSILEVATVNLVSVWFIVSALAALIVSIFVDSLLIQMSVFVLFGVFLLFTTRKPLQKMVDERREKTNLDRILDMNGIVIEKISKNKEGSVKIDGKVWTAYSDEEIEVDSIVKVLEIKSVKLKVKKVED